VLLLLPQSPSLLCQRLNHTTCLRGTTRTSSAHCPKWISVMHEKNVIHSESKLIYFSQQNLTFDAKPEYARQSQSEVLNLYSRLINP